MPNGALTDREYIVKLYTMMDGMREDISEMKETFQQRPYPCSQTTKNDRRIGKLEIERNIIVGVVAIAIPILTACILWLIDTVF